VRPAPPKDQLGRNQLVQDRRQVRPAQRCEDLEQLKGELATDHRGDLSDFACAAEPIQTGHERVVQGRRDRQGRQRTGELVAIARGDQQSRFEHHLGQLLDEQRYAVGALGDLLEDVGRNSPAVADPRDHVDDLAATQARQ
jgi:hypothetical protein